VGERAIDVLLAERVRGTAALLTAALRIGCGAVFLAFGIYKFTDHGDEVAALDSYGLPSPDQFTYGIGVLEVGGGLLLGLGLLTRLAALVLAGDMVGAVATAGVVEGGPIHLALAPALLVSMIFLLWAGPGALALDGRLRCTLRFAGGERPPRGADTPTGDDEARVSTR
jgi:putative oxidoreductase